MIDFNKIVNTSRKRVNTAHTVRATRRIKSNNKITKENRKFLKALGFKI